MKSKIIKLLLIISIIFSLLGINNTYAEGLIEVKVPIDFSPVINLNPITGGGCSSEKNENGDYTCMVPKGIGGFEFIIAAFVKYITFIASLAGVLFIVVNGIMYSMGGANDSLKTESKKRIIRTLIGLILLLMSGIILHVIAPWVYT